MTRDERADMYLEYLAEEGYRPNKDDDGDVVFKAEGLTYYIIVDEQDAQYFRLLHANFWSIDSPEELLQAFEAASFASRQTKVAKVYVREDAKNTSATVEMFVEPPDNFRATFSRAMGAMRTCVNNFKDKMGQLRR